MAKNIVTLKYIQQTPFEFAAGAGFIPNVSAINKFGHNTSVDAGALEDVWEAGGLYPFQTSAQLTQVLSSSAADTAGGTGAGTITIEGLDGNYNEVSVTIALAGTTIVPTLTPFLRVHRAYVTRAGSGATNAGSISVETIGGVVQASIRASFAQTMQALYTVPTNHSALVTHYYAGLEGPPSGGDIDFRFVMRPEGGVFRVQHLIDLTDDGTSQYQYRFITPLKFVEHTDIIVHANNESNAAVSVSAGFEVILIEN